MILVLGLLALVGCEKECPKVDPCNVDFEKVLGLGVTDAASAAVDYNKNGAVDASDFAEYLKTCDNR